MKTKMLWIYWIILLLGFFLGWAVFSSHAGQSDGEHIQSTLIKDCSIGWIANIGVIINVPNEGHEKGDKLDLMLFKIEPITDKNGKSWTTYKYIGKYVPQKYPGGETWQQ